MTTWGPGCEGFERAPQQSQSALDAPPFHHEIFADGSVGVEFYRTDAGYRIRFPGLADFAIRRDTLAVICTPARDFCDATPEHLYLNQVLPLVRSARGEFAIHASAVAQGFGAIAFVAPSGRGKSTLAAAFLRAGGGLLTDDGMALSPGAKRFDVLPSHPSIRLWGDSSARLVGAAAEPTMPVGFTTKQRFFTKGCDEPRPLRAAYFIGEGGVSRLALQSLSGAEALMAWASNSFLLDVEDETAIAAHLDRAARLSRAVPSFRLDYPRRFDALDEVVAAVSAHAAKIGSDDRN